MGKSKMHIISHTHWDREWYQDFQGYRQRLVYQMDSLLDLLEKQSEYKCFHLDGQTSCLLDYLEIRPESRERVKDLIVNQCILIGPWFVMPDELLLSGESLIRNLMLGLRICSEFGTKPMPVGYVTDIFGHCSQLPQILKGFGINCVLLHRGTSGVGEKSEMLWKGADGSSVLLLKVYPFTGYEEFIKVKEMDQAELQKYEERKLTHATTNILLGLDGKDHATPRWDATEDIMRLNVAFKGIECVHSSFTSYLKELTEALGNDYEEKLITFNGELRTPKKSGQWNEVFNGTGSSRLPLKQQNDRQEWFLSRCAEPLNAWSTILEGDSQKAFLDLAWKYLLLNHPHDSIVGCSIDQVHKDMRYRFDQSRLLALNSVRESIQVICSRIDTTAFDESNAVVTVFNMSSAAVGPIVEFSFELSSELVADKDSEKLSPALTDFNGNRVEYQLLGIEKGVRTEYLTSKVTKPCPAYDVNSPIQVNRFHIAIQATIPAFGYKSWGIGFASHKIAAASGVSEREVLFRMDEAIKFLENEYIQVAFRKDGCIDLYDKETAAWYRGLHYFEDSGDAGDGWSHGILEKDMIIRSTDKESVNDLSIVSLENGPYCAKVKVALRMFVPSDISMDKKCRENTFSELRIETIFTLRAGQRRLECYTVIHNQAGCHRIKVIFPTGLPCETWVGDTAFDMVKRNVKLIDTTGWDEQIRAEAPIKNFVAAFAGERGLAIMTKGLNEACVEDNSERNIALTLFRSFSENLLYEETKDSLLLGEVIAEYAIAPITINDNDSPAAIFSESDGYKLPLLSCTKPVHTGCLNSEEQMVEIGSPLVLSTFKVSEDESGFILRVFNPLEHEVSTYIYPRFPFGLIWKTDYNEKCLEPLESSCEGNIPISLRGKEVATFLLERKKQ